MDVRPAWQRARFVLNEGPQAHLRGRELFVLSLKPTAIEFSAVRRQELKVEEPAYVTHLLDDYGNRVVVAHDLVELLGRDEGDFAMDVEREQVDAWMSRGA